MRNRRTAYLLGVAILLAGTSGACGDDDSPRNPVTPTPTPNTPVPPRTIRIRLTGPTTVSIGEPSQFTVAAEMSDGTTRDATTEATWRTNTTYLEMTAPGRFVGRASGEAFVNAQIPGVGSSTISAIIVVPRGTFRLSGTVRDQGVPIRGATVAIDSEALGRTTIVATDGTFRVYGVGGLTRVSAAKDGYETAFKDQTISSHQSIDLDLALSGPRRSVGGTYALRIAAPSASCPNLRGLTERSYVADVAQSGATLIVTLSGATFADDRGAARNQFAGVLQGADATFTLKNNLYYYYYYSPFPGFFPDLMEQVDSNTYISFSGVASTSVTPQGLSGRLSGTVIIYSGTRFAFVGSCRSSNIDFVMTR